MIYLKRHFVLQIFYHFSRSYRKISQKKLQTWLQKFYKAKCILVIGRAFLLLIWLVWNKILRLYLFPEKNFMACFYRCGSIASRLEPLRWGSLHFTKLPRNCWYSFYQPRKNEKLSQPWSRPMVLNTDPWIGNPAP